MTATKLQPYVNARESSAVWFLGTKTMIRSTGETTSGAFGLIEQLIPSGFASPYHTHHLEDEAFYVLEGEVTFISDGQWFKAGTGAYVFGPREIPHGFKIEGPAPARVLILCTPGGFEQFVLDNSDPVTDPALPPPAPDMAKLMTLAAKYQIDIHGPLPEQIGAAGSVAMSDSGRIESLRAAHCAALNARNAGAFSDLFTEDAVQMPPNMPANVGRANIRSWVEAFLLAFKVKFSLSVAELRISGDQACESGAYKIVLTPDAGGQEMEEVGKYITVYQRLSSGGWAMTRDIWNTDQPR